MCATASILPLPYLAALLLTPSAVSGLPMPEPKIQARVEFTSENTWRDFLLLEGLDVVDTRRGEMVRIVTDSQQIESLRHRGFHVEVEIENMQEYYASAMSAENFGAYHTYSETEQFLNELHAAYPSITTEKMAIGESWEGRSIWAMRISDNPQVDEDEPEVLLDALHHAREPMSLEVLLAYMRWLCEEYGSDAEATFLVDNREIWSVPVVNPDGYVYNELAYPTGGGMWRKNLRDNGDGTWGVDPNRNYPYRWGGDGASEDTDTEIYRGRFRDRSRRFRP
jgi:murein tripeptide amidase MpaA